MFAAKSAARGRVDMTTEVTVPVLGESISEATLGTWLKKPGEAVALDEAIASLETDKVAIEVTASAAGIMGTQFVAEGDTVSVGAVIAAIEATGATPASAPAAAPLSAPAPAAVTADASADLTLSPAVRRVVLEHGLDPSKIKGTGKDGRLTKEDVLVAATTPVATAPATPAPAPVAAASPTPNARPEERVRMTRLRQTVARRLKEAQETAALLTTFNDVDMTAVIEARAKYKDLFEKKHGVRLGFMGFFVKAACMALRDIPSVNAMIDGDEIVYHNYADMRIRCRSPKSKKPLVISVPRQRPAQ
jgi:2-oxoglutarate dehydrogenase E2 component (dihydrolipoamide succinyltransferase)